MTGSGDIGGSAGIGSSIFSAPAAGVETTGRYLILFREEAVGQAVSLLSSTAGFLSASAADFEGVDSVAGADAVVFDKLGVAVVSSVPPELHRLAATDQGTSPILAIEPERVMYAIQDVLSLEDVVAPPVDTGTPPVRTGRTSCRRCT